VVADMIEGVIVHNGVAGAKADRLRAALWASVANALEQAA
jgi:hypothetical protein